MSLLYKFSWWCFHFATAFLRIAAFVSSFATTQLILFPLFTLILFHSFPSAQSIWLPLFFVSVFRFFPRYLSFPLGSFLRFIHLQRFYGRHRSVIDWDLRAFFCKMNAVGNDGKFKWKWCVRHYYQTFNLSIQSTSKNSNNNRRIKFFF